MTPFEALGGEAAVRALVEAFYDQMELHQVALAQLHELDAEGRISRGARDRFALFLCYWLGGPNDYLREQGPPRLRMRHARVGIDVAMRDAWLDAMTRAMDARGVTGQARAFLDQRFAEVADFLRNREG